MMKEHLHPDCRKLSAEQMAIYDEWVYLLYRWGDMDADARHEQALAHALAEPGRSRRGARPAVPGWSSSPVYGAVR
jgi:hypothetical protein